MGVVVPLDIEMIDQGDYVRLVLTGDFPSQLPEAVDVFARLSTMTGASGHTRCLSDARNMGRRMSIPAIFEFVTLAYPEEPDTMRSAALDAPENMVSARFFENLMRSRGRTYRVFTDEAEAVAWLLSDKP